MGHQEITAFLRHLWDLSGRRRLNWPELLLRHARICEQRKRRRREERRRAILEKKNTEKTEEENAEVPAVPGVAEGLESERDNEIRQLVNETVGGVIAVSGGPSISEPGQIAALAGLAAAKRRDRVGTDENGRGRDAVTAVRVVCEQQETCET